MDVLKQLEQRVRDQILTQRRQASESQKQALVKLERDFERVQGLAQSAKAKVARQQKQFQQRGGAGGAANAAALEQNTAANTLQMQQERFQIQLQQDVSMPSYLVALQE